MKSYIHRKTINELKFIDTNGNVLTQEECRNIIVNELGDCLVSVRSLAKVMLDGYTPEEIIKFHEVSLAFNRVSLFNPKWVIEQAELAIASVKLFLKLFTVYDLRMQQYYVKESYFRCKHWPYNQPKKPTIIVPKTNNKKRIKKSKHFEYATVG